MSLITAGAVSLGVAFALHVFAMTAASYGAFSASDETTSAEKACQSMLILASLSYAIAFLQALLRASSDSASESKLLKFGSAASAAAGVLYFLVGIIIVGVKKSEFDTSLISYHLATYSLAAVFALYGGIVALVADRGSEQEYTRGP